MVAIHRVIPLVGDRLRDLERAVRTGQDPQSKAMEQLTREVKELSATIRDFISGFQMTFTPGRSRMLAQGLRSYPP